MKVTAHFCYVVIVCFTLLLCWYVGFVVEVKILDTEVFLRS